jgi:hypothetical protein
MIRPQTVDGEPAGPQGPHSLSECAALACGASLSAMAVIIGAMGRSPAAGACEPLSDSCPPVDGLRPVRGGVPFGEAAAFAASLRLRCISSKTSIC